MAGDPPAAGAERDASAGDDARSHFAAFLERWHAGDSDLEALCADHPAHAASFRRWLAALQATGELANDGVALPLTEDAPATIAGCRLLRELGRGGMGRVFLAEEIALERRVAVKLLAPGSSLDPDARVRFEREIKALATLSHPHIVAVHRAELGGAAPAIVMELVVGASLAALLQALRTVAPAPEDRTHALVVAALARAAETDEVALESDGFNWFAFAARLAAETAEALEHAHRHGILHRDVKPGNVLVNVTGSTRLADFGLARIRGAETVTRTGSFAGTPAYAAPEQISAEFGPLDGRTDVHAVGILLHELLTGSVPFVEEDAHALFRRILTESPPSPRARSRAVPVELAIVCAKASERRPDHRYPSAAALAADLRAWLAGRPIVARPPSVRRRTVAALRRRPLVTWVASLLVLAGLATLVWDRVDAWRSLRARRLAAQEGLARFPAGLDELEAIARTVAASSEGLDQFRLAALDGPLDDAQRRRRGELAQAAGAAVRTAAARVRAFALELAEHAELLGVDAVAPARRELGLRGTELARTIGARDAALANPLLVEFARIPGVVELLFTTEPTGRLALTVAPADAAIELYRYGRELELDPESRFDRILPRACDATGVFLRQDLGNAWRPGQPCTTIVRLAAGGTAAKAGFAVGDQILGRGDADALARPASAARPVRVWRDGSAIELSWPLQGDPDAELAPTLAPLLNDARNRFQGAAGLPAEVPAGSYLLLVRRDGFAESRVPVRIDAHAVTTQAIDLTPAAEMPPGFIKVEGGPFIAGAAGDADRRRLSEPSLRPFFIARRETTFGDYFDALRWKEARTPGSARARLPGQPLRDVAPPWPPPWWAFDRATLEIRDEEFARTALHGVRPPDVDFFLDILNQRAQERGDPWLFELLFDLSWEKAARGTDGRPHVWGNVVMDWELCIGRRSRFAAGSAPRPLASDAFLGDESPYGVLALNGNVAEFVRRDEAAPPGRPPIRGGSFADVSAEAFILASEAATPPPPHAVGIRLAARSRSMAPQGLERADGEPPR